jgi:hypothetical protein
MQALSLTMFSVVVFSVVVPSMVFIGVCIYKAVSPHGEQHGFRKVMRAALPLALIAAGIEIVLWVTLFAHRVAVTAYQDHRDLVAATASKVGFGHDPQLP